MSSYSSEASRLNSFGQLLRMLRKRSGLSQLRLSEKAKTTPRYISFLETGRSRPGREVVHRIAKALNLPKRELNLLLAGAGIASEYIAHDSSVSGNDRVLQSAQAILDNHNPYPACAVDTLSRIVMSNDAFERFSPGMSNRTAEQSIDDFFGSQVTRDLIENWAELAWAFIDRRQFEAVRSSDARLLALSERALGHMGEIERPDDYLTNSISMTLDVRFRLGDEVLSTYATVLRYESVKESALSELRLELIHPSNQQTADFFKRLSEE